MAAPTKAKLATVRGFLTRADRRINGAAKAATRPGTDPGEFDNNFDGVVTAILHVVDAYELATTGIKRRVGEAEQATRIESVLAALRAAKTPRVPPGSRLIDLNVRRNTSVHGEWGRFSIRTHSRMPYALRVNSSAPCATAWPRRD
jgi:hypothetical protein